MSGRWYRQDSPTRLIPKGLFMSELIKKIYANLNYQKQFGDLLYLDKSFSQSIKNIEVNNEEITIKQTQQTKTEARKKTGTSVNPNWQTSSNLDELKQNIHNCFECELGHTRKNFVFGSGNSKSKILIIGEAPGADEDEQGIPFIGRAGQLLTKILEAINFTRDEVYIANIIKCRPPENRRPKPTEVEECEPYLKKQIEILNPEFILALGLTAVNTLLKGDYKMKDVRGKVLEYEGRKLLITYHPAALLRNPSWKRQAWEDVQQLRAMYDEYQAKNNI